jgi:cephalosporin hydroxylase
MRTLSEIAVKHETDKGLQHHGYTEIYDKYFREFVGKGITMLEIGVGGYHFNNRGGGSLNMWAEYFDNARIIGVDLYDKSAIKKDHRVELHKFSQDDGMSFYNLFQQGVPDIVIDDASHINDLTIQTFKIVFPYLKEGAMYVVEDTHTSYWKENFRGTTDLESKETAIGFFRHQLHSLQIESGVENYFGIKSIHFYPKQIFIFK